VARSALSLAHHHHEVLCQSVGRRQCRVGLLHALQIRALLGLEVGQPAASSRRTWATKRMTFEAP